MAVELEAAAALERQLSPGVQRIACIPGPALMRTELRRHVPTETEELADYDYAGDAFAAAIHAACESGVNGIAVIEDLPADDADEISFLYSSARKVVDFYSRIFLVLLQPGSSLTESVGMADQVFRLPAEPQELSLVKAEGGSTAFTTAYDVPPDVPVEMLQALCAQATR